MTRPSDEFGPDLSEAIPDTFEFCPDCGRPTVHLHGHQCPDDSVTDDPTREELDRRVANDPYPDDEIVLVRRTGRRKTYAYHERDADGNPLCPVNYDGFRERTRVEAQKRRFAPCQYCHRIRQANETDDHGDDDE